MDRYVFYDTDIEGYEEYDIRGEAYEKLIRLCCQYGAVLYLKFTHPDLSAYNSLKNFEIPKPQNIPDDPAQIGPYCDKRYFTVCPELCDILLHIAGGIFEWMSGRDNLKNPDDPTFYRADGTVFFASEIHEGVCVLAPRTGEDAADVLDAIDWITGVRETVLSVDKVNHL